MKKVFILLLLQNSAAIIFAQTQQEKDAIKNLCGCFAVDFKYAETFAPDESYKFPNRYYAEGLEWVTQPEATGKKFVLQHLLVIDDSTIIKHWREDWEYEKKDLWQFQHDATWKRVETNEPVKGEWTQTVWEVDDAPRYQGRSKWINYDGEYFWENKTDAPLPRREYTKRSDYNVMQRINKIIITDTGYVHEQDNEKLVRKDGETDKLIAQEKGYNIYHKLNDTVCASAAAWWNKHAAFWVTVRNAWNEILKDKSEIHLTSKVDGQLLYEQLDKLEEEHLTADALKSRINLLLNQYASVSKSSSEVVQTGK